MYIISSICFPKTVFPVSLKTNVFLSICLIVSIYIPMSRINSHIICVKSQNKSSHNMPQDCQGLRINLMSQNKLSSNWRAIRSVSNPN